jgi:hypothetical protein
MGFGKNFQRYARGVKKTQKAIKNADTSTVSGRIRKQMGMDTRAGRGKDIVEGAQFGEAVLGKEGLGILGDASQFQTQDDGTMAAMKAQAAELAKGFSSEEMLARKEKGIEEIQGSAAAQSRAMQAQLARSGVKGMAAGQQLGNIAMAGIEARGNLERDLMIANREAQMQGLQQLSGIHGQDIAAQQFNVGQALGVKKFDLSQAAKEKDIALQAGLGFAQMGSTERAAELNRQAQVKAARAGRQKSCFIEGTMIEMNDGSYKKIEEIELGDVIRGGIVYSIVSSLATEIYLYNGVAVTGNHAVREESWKRIKDTNAEKFEGVFPVYNLGTSQHRIFTQGIEFADFDETDLGSEISDSESLEELNGDVKELLESGTRVRHNL